MTSQGQGYDNEVVFDPAVRVLQNVLQQCEEKGVDESIKQGIQLAIKLTEDRMRYCEEVTTAPSPALENLSSGTRSCEFEKAFEKGETNWKLGPVMMSGGLEGKVLQSIVMMTKAKRVLEVGMFTGYAALACAEALPEDGEVTTCEFEPYLKDVARSFFNNSPHGRKIDIRIGPASDTLIDLAKEKRQYDVIFIDANKDGYLDYYKTIMAENLLAENGVIAMDNTLYFGLPYCIDDASSQEIISQSLKDGQRKNAEAIKKLNDFLVTQDDIFRVLLPIRDGILLVQRKPKTL